MSLTAKMTPKLTLISKKGRKFWEVRFCCLKRKDLNLKSFNNKKRNSASGSMKTFWRSTK